VVINLHHLGEVIERHVGDGSAFGVRVTYSREAELLGTAGALKPVEDQLRTGPFLVVYGDNYLDFDLHKLTRAHANNAAVATIALFSPRRHPNTGVVGGRVEMDGAGRILRFVEGREDLGLELANAGVYVVEPSLLDHIPADRPCDFGRDLFPLVLRHHGILCGHVIDGVCLAVDTPAALAGAQKLLEERAVEGGAEA
jgi:NDP-sugar pyrophosphorylase family protein